MWDDLTPWELAHPAHLSREAPGLAWQGPASPSRQRGATSGLPPGRPAAADRSVTGCTEVTARRALFAEGRGGARGGGFQGGLAPFHAGCWLTRPLGQRTKSHRAGVGPRGACRCPFGRVRSAGYSCSSPVQTRQWGARSGPTETHILALLQGLGSHAQTQPCLSSPMHMLSHTHTHTHAPCGFLPPTLLVCIGDLGTCRLDHRLLT